MKENALFSADIFQIHKYQILFLVNMRNMSSR